jgi:putative ABC transport system permease protein
VQLEVGLRLGVAMAVLVAVAGVGATVAGLGLGPAAVRAAARAAVQLAVVSALVATIVGSVGWTSAFLVVMAVVATATSARRVTRDRSGWWVAVPIGLGVAPVVVGLLVADVVPAKGIVLVPVAGILIGGAMTATSLAGARTLDELARRRGEVEAALALGFTDRDARLEVARPVAGTALVPGLDQTRTVGIVTLPGAFVGMLLGGARPVDAGAVQLFVLVALLAVQVVAVAATLELVARGRLRAADLGA